MKKSRDLFQSALKLIPGGVNSPVRAFGAVGGEPRFIAHAKGAYLTDVDGNQLIDYIGSWGPMILGHADPIVTEAVIHAAKNSLSFGAPCENEILLAKEICARVPSIKKIRMMNSGTESAMTAIRLARGFTQHDKIIKFNGCYHGHADHLLVKAGSGALTFNIPSSAGVPKNFTQETLIAEFNNVNSVTELFEKNPDQIACVILEPIAGNMNFVPPNPGFLESMREICNHYGALLIFDEVMTGFRVSFQGMQGLTKVTPDLTIFGKIIGGGMPVGAVGGREEIMNCLSPLGSVYQAGTLSGNPIAMAAGLATLKQLTPEKYKILAEKTRILMDGLTARAKASNIAFTTQHATGMFGFYFTHAKKITSYADVMQCNVTNFNVFFNAMLNAGIYFAPSAYEAGFISLAHDDAAIQKTLDAAERVFSANLLISR